jgi:hypothetical protein
MIAPRTRALTVGFAALGMLSLAGCADLTAAADDSATASGSDSSATPDSSSSYADGTYTVEASYQAPSGVESIAVELTLAGDTVTAVSAAGDASDHEAREYQERFASAISAEVVGQDIANLSVTRVAGASLTSNGFNTALEEIRAEAA